MHHLNCDLERHSGMFQHDEWEVIGSWFNTNGSTVDLFICGLLFTVSFAYGQLQSKSVKWKIPDINKS
jgi:hypothetical protein